MKKMIFLADIFKNVLIDIDIIIDIFKNVLIDIDIFRIVLIDIFKNGLIDIDIFNNTPPGAKLGLCRSIIFSKLIQKF